MHRLGLLGDGGVEVRCLLRASQAENPHCSSRGLGPLLCWGRVLGKLVCVTLRGGEVIWSSAADPYSPWAVRLQSHPWKAF